MWIVYLILAVVPGLVIVTPAVFPRFVLNHDLAMSAMMFINIYSLFIYGWRIFTILYTDNITYFARLGDCFFLFVSNTLQNVWAQNFVWDLAWQQGRFMDAQNYKNLFLFDFVFVLYCTKRRSLQIKPQLKVEIEDGREAPWMPSII